MAEISIMAERIREMPAEYALFSDLVGVLNAFCGII
jgi:hypothetical protein